MPLDETREIFEFKVQYSAGAYVTSTVRGQRASSTDSAKRAAAALAHKLIPGRAATVEKVSLRDEPVQVWRAWA